MLRLVRLYRIRDWVHFLPLPLLVPADLAVAIGAVLAFAGALAYAAAINNASDAKSDNPRARKNPVAAGAISPRQARWLALPPAVICLASSALWSPRGFSAALLLLVTSTLYSAPPRLKAVPFVGSLWNLLVFAPGAFLCGWIEDPRRWLLLALFALLLLVSQLLHELQDHEEDVAASVRTTAAVLGVRGTRLVGTLLVSMAPLFCLGLGQTALGLVAAFSLCWALLLTWGDPKKLRIPYRYTVLLLGAIVWRLLG